ncbi:hypothetical protein AM228_15420 [Planktothricoides sp. SR001]|nr:hypothetical protein AM228_15420 [Planktothricoides sp. SR001]
MPQCFALIYGINQIPPNEGFVGAKHWADILWGKTHIFAPMLRPDLSIGQIFYGEKPEFLPQCFALIHSGYCPNEVQRFSGFPPQFTPAKAWGGNDKFFL